MIKTIEDKDYPNHLYIHIPFCKHICAYCDFVRKVPQCENEVNNYLDKIINQLKQIDNNKKFNTIYIGGGTPNSLTNNQLIKLLSICAQHIFFDTEFTIECNPELVNLQQVEIFKKYGINRISLGVQTVNEHILKLFNRKHNVNDVLKAINIFRTNGINNISLDFIYGFKLMNKNDIQNDIDFVIKNKIPHVSMYSLEIKPGSYFAKQNYELNDELIDQQFKQIIDQLQENKYERYEVSNWCLDSNFRSKHNLAYWHTNDWLAIGLGAYGLEKMNYYHYEGNVNNFKKVNQQYSLKEYYQHILIMGLRLIEGMDLSIEKNLKAYEFFKNDINPNLIEIKNNHLKAKNINQLDDILISII